MAARKMIGACAVCGRRIQRNGTSAPWRHQRPRPDGSPHDHKAVIETEMTLQEMIDHDASVNLFAVRVDEDDEGGWP